MLGTAGKIREGLIIGTDCDAEGVGVRMMGLTLPYSEGKLFSVLKQENEQIKLIISPCSQYAVLKL